MKSMSNRTAAGLGILFLVVTLIAVNVIAGSLFRSAKLDLTANRLYTLSSGTRSMLKKLDEPITLRLYFSERLAADYQQMSAYGTRVRDLLREMVGAAHGKLLLQVIDPEPFSPEEELPRAMASPALRPRVAKSSSSDLSAPTSSTARRRSRSCRRNGKSTSNTTSRRSFTPCRRRRSRSSASSPACRSRPGPAV